MIKKLPIPIFIICGGKATRLGSLTENIPKSFVEIANKPFIDYQIELLKHKHFREIVLLLGHYGTQIQDHIVKNKYFGLDIKFSYDGLFPLGTGGAVKKAFRYFGKSAFVTYGDSYLPGVNYHELLNALERSKDKIALITVYENNNNLIKSNICLSENKKEILEYDKNSNNPSMQYCDYGVMLFKQKHKKERLFPPALANKNSFDLSELIQYLVSKKLIVPYIIKERFYEIGSLEGIKDLENYLLEKGKNKNG